MSLLALDPVRELDVAGLVALDEMVDAQRLDISFEQQPFRLLAASILDPGQAARPLLVQPRLEDGIIADQLRRVEAVLGAGIDRRLELIDGAAVGVSAVAEEP